MPSIFSKIMAGEIPCAKVWEDDEFFAFLDIMPVAPGHTLVVPKEEVDYFFDIDEAKYLRLMSACRKVATVIKKTTGCKRVSVGVFGFEVAHAHVHLIPMDSLSQFPFPPRDKATPEALQEMAAKLQGGF